MKVEQAHQGLKGLLLNGRILINGLPLTGNEVMGMLQCEQLLYEKAFQFEKEAAEKKAKAPKEPKKK